MTKTPVSAELPEAPQPVFDAQGFREWLLSNLPDDTIIGSSAWWADHLTKWARSFVKHVPAQVEALSAAQAGVPAKVSTRHPTVVHWRNDGIEACAKIASVYGCDDAARDMRVMLTATPQPSPSPAPAEAVERIVHLRADREKRVYVAGPMTGLPQFNFPLFNATAARLRSEGWHVENPAEHGHVEGAGWADYLRWDISRVATCGAVYLLPGWSKSKGATLEVHIAQVLGLRVLLADGAEQPQASPAPAQPGQEGERYNKLPEHVVSAVDGWFAKNTGLGGCSDKDANELADIFYSVHHAGGRESLDDALEVVGSFGTGIAGLNDTYARQILLADEVKRLRAARAAPQPATTITVEQVEDYIGLQSGAWNTIGAEKIVEAVLRLANIAPHPATEDAPKPGERCQWCVDRHDGFYGSYAPECPHHDDDGKQRAAKREAKP